MTASAAAANAQRNTSRVWRRKIDWRPARASAWALLDRYIADGARVAIVGVGNGDDLPLRKLARRAGTLDLIDIDPRAMGDTARRMGRTRARVSTIAQDATDGATDTVIARATSGTGDVTYPPLTSLGRGDYDVVVGDLLYTQLLYPALQDARLPGRTIDRLLLQHGQRITNGVVARMHAAAPGGIVIHLHDILSWWPGNHQRFTLDEVLALPPDQALALANTGWVPYGCDPREGSTRAGATITDTAFWRWNFGMGKQFLVCATVAET